MYKLAVLDMDGTLLNSSHIVSEENLKALDYLKELGVRVVIATGRPKELLKKYTRELAIDEYVINCNGSVISHPFNDDVLHENIINPKTVIKIVDMCEQYGYDYLLYTKEAIISKNNEKLRIIKKIGIGYDKDDKVNIIETEDSEYIKYNFAPNKILITEKDSIEYLKMIERVKEIENIEYAQSWQGALDISPIGDNKGNAVKKVCKHYGINQEEVVAFGDNLNDISMITFAGMGVAMGNAMEELKIIANHITDTNDNNGVAKAIYKVFGVN
ncbi:MAG: HAD family phosphatase [Candidatus Izimaplasma sp.]|nr:HAD family phosphatase [Candidatus Izimaplasma bacterium]